MALSSGSIAFTGFNADGNDNLAFVALEDIPAGSIIYFSDNEWNGTAWTDFNENVFSWTAASTIATGSIVALNSLGAAGATSPQGTIAAVAGGGTNLGMGNSGEMIYAYVASEATPHVPTIFLTAVSNNSATSGSLTGTGLTYGVNAIDLSAIDTDADIGAYNGSRSSEANFAAYVAKINTAANWITQDASGDQSIDATGPDVPFSTAAFSLATPSQTIQFASGSLSLSQSEGQSGTKTFTFTVERSGATTGQIDFTGTVGAGATDAADFGGTAPTSFSGSIADGANTATVSIQISGDTTFESDDAFSLTLTGGTNTQGTTVSVNAAAATATATIVNDDYGLSIGGINVYGAADSTLHGSTTTPTASNDLVLVRLGSIAGAPAGAESVAYEGGKVYSTNLNGNNIGVATVTAAGTLVGGTPIDLTGLTNYKTGGVNGVAVKNGVIAVAYEHTTAGQAGYVALFNAADNSLIKTIQVGVLPDQLTFSPDGTKLLVANEAETVSAGVNPAGSISIIDLSGGAAAAAVSNTIGFGSLDGAESVLRERGLATMSGQAASADIEPEYISISPDGTRAYVTLQEVNAVAVIDLTNASADRPLAIQPLGSVDWSLAGNALDASDRDGAGGTAAINIHNAPVSGLLQPDAIASFAVGGVTYFVTANEGDARVVLTDSVRLNSASYVLDPTLFPNAAALKADANLGRLNVLTNVGDTDGDGDFDQIFTLGGRGITIFRQEADGTITKIRETGGEFEAITAALNPTGFNSNQSTAGSSLDTRSDDKGPEPEGVTIGQVDGRTYAFVGLERVGGYMVYDVTDPANATFVSYKPQTGSDLGPETSAFVSAANSPTGQALLLSGQEISNTTTLYSIQTQSEGDDTIVGGADAESWNGRGGDDLITGNGGSDTIDGGTGTDTAAFVATWADSTVAAGGTTVTSTVDGTDTLTNVENLRFAGMSVAAVDAVNDAPIGVSDSATGLVEDGNSTATGNVLANDTDADAGLGLGETKTVTGARSGAEAAAGSLTVVAGATVIDGLYGTLTINPDGSYAYALDNARAATQALTAGEQVIDAFTYQVADAHGLTDQAQLSVGVSGANENQNFTLQILHFSDAEAGLLAGETAPNFAALVDAFEDDYANSITVASGDLFLPGPFLAAGTDPSLASLVPGNSNAGRVDISIMNAIGVELSAIGNHEFDLGSNVFAAAITPGSGYAGALFPYLSANLDFSGDSALNPRFTQTVGVNGLEAASSLKGRIAPSAVLTEGGEKIGFVGATTQVLESISSPSGTEVKGFPTGVGANGEINDMDLLAAQLQPVIDDLIGQGVNKIVLVSHLQQIQFEQLLATKLHGVDVIISGGSNTRLGDADDIAVDFPGHSAAFEGSYPIVTAGTDGKTTLIVNTDSEFTYLGRLVVDFDANGDIVTDSLAANLPISGAYAATDANVAEAWGVQIADLGTTAFAEGTRGETVADFTEAVTNVITVKDGNIFGFSSVYLEGERSQVRTQETNLGDLSADANADAARDALGLTSDHAIVSIKNGGGIRAQIGTIINNADGTVTKVGPEVGGEVSQLDVENALRFDNKLMVFDTTAQGLLNILNSPNAVNPNNGGFIQIGGVRFSYDPTKAAGSRIQDIVLINEHDQITAVIADNGVVNPTAPAKISVVALNFTANGGDGYVVKANADNFRFLLNDGTLSAAVNEALDFTATGVVPANALGEIKAFSDYMGERYATAETAYDVADTGQALDTRIQNQSARTDTVLEGDYLLLGTAALDRISGTAGAETIKGLAGNDIINGNAGDDILIGGLGADRLIGGEGIDTVDYAAAASGIAVDLVSGRGSYGEATGDRLTTVENLIGSAFADVLSGSRAVNVIHGGAGDDVIDGEGGLDQLFGDTGNDTFILDRVKVALVDGGDGFDTIEVSDDNIALSWGNFLGIEAISSGGFDNVTLVGGIANDVIDLSAMTIEGIVSISGGAGNDTVTGSAGDDRLLGVAGNDTLVGGLGDDVLIGGMGADLLTGGDGADHFVFAAATESRATVTDTITDFVSGIDLIDLGAIDANSVLADNQAFSFIGSGAFTKVAGQLHYELVGGDVRLSGDINGDGRADFALLLSGVSTLTANDFIL